MRADPEAVEILVLGRIRQAAIGRAELASHRFKAPAAKRAGLARRGRAIVHLIAEQIPGLRHFIIPVKVVAPLVYVAQHVEQSIIVRAQQSDGVRLFIGIG